MWWLFHRLSFGALLFLPVMASAAPLTVVSAITQDVNCAFEADCTFPITDGATSFNLPGSTGSAQLRERIFSGKSGLPATIKHGYEYRLDLSQVTTLTDATCVSSLEVDFGPVIKLQYNRTGPLDDVFVIRTAPGTIGLTSAEQIGNAITFTLEQPVCAGDGVSQGKSSFFFGLASAHGLKPTKAKINGPGFGDPIKVRAGTPDH